MPGLNKIGIDGDALRKPLSGVGQYIYNLCCELDTLLPNTEFFIYTRLSAEEVAIPASRWHLRNESNGLARKLPSFLWMKTFGLALAKKDNLDVFWAGRTIHPGLSAAKEVVITVHDLNHKLVPETMQLATRLSHKLWFDKDVKNATKVFTNSQGTSNRLQEWVGRGADLVIHPGVSANFHPLDEASQASATAALAPLGISAPYLLAVSTLEPRKNMSVLIDAFVQLKHQGAIAQHQLVLVGARGWQNNELAEKIEANKQFGIVLPGYVADELIPSIYAMADILIMPSKYEGFGMPVVEARAVKTPVIISDVAELIEASAGEATIIKAEVDALQQAILAVLDTPEANLPIQTRPANWHDSAQILTTGLVTTTFDRE
ncbi:glycosyltransferase family 4 protein [Oceanisphaera avium]|uniref:Glycosyl transferase family 1 domain-containing protein n=1 Tax=Oceanisphaera avium TaxID=1903694 RepID=A0A1Y0D0Y6_9GAMM|nr:glycosyltransferase family 1 protein [Oceanisphaera avium]ART80934.1 hypothetical protein CBP12_12865 [Oceanisphaera avium]